jgi:hypothetical protein
MFSVANTVTNPDYMKSEQLKKYEADYSELPFEDVLRTYRQENIFTQLAATGAKRILEIGSGPLPLFKSMDNFERMVVVEPGDHFFSIAKDLAGDDKRITVIHDFFENIVDELVPEKFDFIILGGFLHEISNPDEVLQLVQKVCHPTTVVHSFVPNAKSFHRLLASEMGLIKDIYQKSAHDELFNRTAVYNMDSFKELFQKNNYSVESFGTYFMKPFTNSQMQQMVLSQIITASVLEGLNKIIRYFPDNGSEMFINGIMNSL